MKAINYFLVIALMAVTFSSCNSKKSESENNLGSPEQEVVDNPEVTETEGEEAPEPEPQPQEAVIDSTGLILSILNDSVGVRDADGNWILPREYRKINHVEKYGWFRVIRRGDFAEALFSLKGDTILGFSNYWINIQETCMEVQNLETKKCGVLSFSLDTIVPVKYAEVETILEGKFFAAKDSLWGLLDANAKEILPLEYDGVYEKDGVVITQKGELWGGYSPETNVSFAPNFKSLMHWRDGIFVGKKYQHQYIVDTKAKKEYQLPEYELVTLNASMPILVAEDSAGMHALTKENKMLFSGFEKTTLEVDSLESPTGGVLLFINDSTLTRVNAKGELAGNFSKFIFKGKLQPENREATDEEKSSLPWADAW